VNLLALHVMATDEGEQRGQNGLVLLEDDARSAPRVERRERLVDRERASLDRLTCEHDVVRTSMPRASWSGSRSSETYGRSG
jgi:hypothetical protein